MRILWVVVACCFLLGFPSTARAQSRSTTPRVAAIVAMQQTSCRRVALTLGPIGLAGAIGNLGRDGRLEAANQAGKTHELVYVIAGSAAGGAGFTSAGAAMCWTASSVRARHLRQRLAREPLPEPSLSSAEWGFRLDQAERHRSIGRLVTFAGGGVFGLGLLASAAHQVTIEDRGFDQLGAGGVLLIGGTLMASLGAATWMDGAAQGRALMGIPRSGSSTGFGVTPLRRGLRVGGVIRF